MRTVRPQGRTFRITQPHGLRVSHIGMHPGLCNRSNRIVTGYRSVYTLQYEALGQSLFAPPADPTLNGRLSRDRCPYRKPKTVTASANRLIHAPDERSLQIDLVRFDRTVPIAGCIGSRDPRPSTPTQRVAAQIPEAIGVRQR